MDHRITIVVVAVFGGTLAFTFLVVSLTQSVDPAAARAALVSPDEAEDAQPAVSPRDQLVQVLQSLDRSTEQWRRDHGGRHPDFQAYAAWEQFLQKTGADGRPQTGSRGSYLAEAPVNPLNKLSTVVSVDRPLRPADRVPELGWRVGFVYSTVDRCYWGTNGSARTILARGSEPPPAPAAVPATPPTTRPATRPIPRAPTTLPTRP